MRLIIKENEPQSLTTYKQSEGAKFSNLSSSCKLDIKNQLLREQRNLCAYCMGKITLANMKIEHYIPQNQQTGDPSKQLDYKNLLAVCMGGEENRDRSSRTCDTHKGNTVLTNVDPQKATIESLLKYEERTGKIIVENDDVLKEIEKVLNLNCDMLKLNRATALKALKSKIDKEHRGRRIKASALGVVYTKCETLPYAGILLYYLRKKLRTTI